MWAEAGGSHNNCILLCPRGLSWSFNSVKDGVVINERDVYAS